MKCFDGDNIRDYELGGASRTYGDRRDKQRAVLNTVRDVQVPLIDWLRNCQLLK